MSTTFQQVATSLVGGFPEYLWSDAANWTAGVPVDGAAAPPHILGGANPSGYDDIAGLFLDSLNLASGFVAVGGTLSVGTVSFGSTTASLYSDTVLGSAAATLTIGAMSGEGRIGAFGATAVTYVLAAADPGEIYQVDEGGELVLNATPSASAPGSRRPSKLPKSERCAGISTRSAGASPAGRKTRPARQHRSVSTSMPATN